MTEKNDIRMSRILAILDRNMTLDPHSLWRVASKLRGMGSGEYVVAAEILEAVLEIRFGKESKPEPKKKIGFDEAYSSMTFS
jgi:hypothetical protein